MRLIRMREDMSASTLRGCAEQVGECARATSSDLNTWQSQDIDGEFTRANWLSTGNGLPAASAQTMPFVSCT